MHRTQIIDETGEKEPYTEEHHCFTFTYGGDLDGIDEPGATLGFTGEHVCVGLLPSSTSLFSLILFFLPILVDDESKGGRGSMYKACRFGNGQEVGYVLLMMGDETQDQRRQSGLS